MSEPTKEQIDEAREMVPIFDGYLSAVNGCPHISVHGLARLIAHVRKKARDDALELAKAALEGERVDGTVSPEDTAYNAAIDHCIGALDAIKYALEQK